MVTIAAPAQKTFLSEYGNEQLKSVPPEKQDSFFVVQGRYYYTFYTRESYRRAMECYLEALRLAILYKHEQVIRQCHFGIGSVYDANNNLPQAIRYYKMYYNGVLKSRPFEPDKILRATYNIAATYAKAQDSASAYQYTLKMAQMLDWLKDSTQLACNRLLIAHTLAGIGRLEESARYFRQIPAQADFRDGELAYGRLYAETSSKYAMYTGRKEAVVPPLLKELARTRDSIPILNLLLKTYALQGRYKEAYECQQLLIAADMRSMDRNTYGDINYRLLEADNLLKQRDNTELRVSGERLRFKSSVLYALSVLLALALVVTIFLYRRHKARNRYAEEQSRLIQEHDETNMLLLKEIHHRVKNNLQIISSMVEMQLNKPETDLYFSMREIQTKMRTIAIAHQMMYEGQELREVDMQTYFERMTVMTVEVLVASAGPVEQRIKMHHNKLGLEKLITLALAVNEMLINSIKHVLPCSIGCYIEMECRMIAEEMHFTYSDNGPDAHEGDIDTVTGTGIRLIHKLARQLDGKILVEKDNGRIQYLIIFTP